jgi:hypothetical protein
MTTDLESEIRDAMHARAQSVTAASLQFPDGPRREHRSSPRVAWSVLAIGAVVAALTVVITIQPWHDGRQAASGGSVVPAVNTTWRLVRADSPDGSIVAGRDLSTRITFKRGGRLLGSDRFGSIEGTYRPTATGFRVYPGGDFGWDYGGHDRRVIEVISAMNALFHSALTGSVDVESHVHGDRLTLEVAGYHLQFRRAG